MKINDLKFRGIEKIPYKLHGELRADLGIGDLGSEVFALGYPWALSGLGKEIKFTDGRISSKTGPNDDKRYFQSNTAIQGGNSGGPLFDFNGNLIGINTSKMMNNDLDLVTYSVKSTYLYKLINSIKPVLDMPSDNSLKNKPLNIQVKTLKKYVVLIKTI